MCAFAFNESKRLDVQKSPVCCDNLYSWYEHNWLRKLTALHYSSTAAIKYQVDRGDN